MQANAHHPENARPRRSDGTACHMNDEELEEVHEVRSGRKFLGDINGSFASDTSQTSGHIIVAHSAWQSRAWIVCEAIVHLHDRSLHRALVVEVDKAEGAVLATLLVHRKPDPRHRTHLRKEPKQILLARLLRYVAHKDAHGGTSQYERRPCATSKLFGP